MESKLSSSEWLTQLHKYSKPDLKICTKQILTAFVPYFVLMLIMVLLVVYRQPYWIVALLSPFAALFLVKIFIILHDCTHRSYLTKSSWACSVLGHICGIFTFTSFYDFKQSHLIHHASVANLEKRGIGDIWTMTVNEYACASFWKRVIYRIFRNPFFLFGVIPTFKFVLIDRFPSSISGRKERLSILFTDLMIALIIFISSMTIGIKAYIAVQLPVISIAAGIGVWIFYIHHNFKGVYWAHEANWDRFKAAMHGSVLYELPPFLRWFTGNIGYHYIHHLNPGIPNYNLVKCRNEIPELKEKEAITLWEGFKSIKFTLWDEKTGKLVEFPTKQASF